ncbi:MAG: hemolysin [Flavobacteriales bacterium]|nr:hemolysin [Flavobacteriales bacterium]|tara:strand:+ start:5543 stop:6571 length:1029 start_codon:yes stop_codon:yes gene_type:complete
MSALIFYLFLALFISFVCSLVEATLLTIPKSYLLSIEKNNEWVTSFLSLKKNIDRPLSAILTLNTIAHTIGAAGVGAEITRLFGDNYLGLASAILTILILFFSEIIPKTIGATYYKGLSKFTLYTLRLMLILTYPFVVISMKITGLVATQKNTSVTREQLSALANLGYDEGVFSKQENRIIQNIIDLKKIKISEIITPRVVVFSADEENTLENFSKENKKIKFSRIPLYSQQIENITGYIFLQDYIEKISDKKNKHSKLKSLRRDILKVPNTINVFALFNQFLEKKEHISIVIDEYGGLVGIVTLEDILETLIGLEIIDESDQEVDMQKFARQKWKNKNPIR